MRPSGARAGATLPRDLNCPRAQFYRNWLEHPQDALHRTGSDGTSANLAARPRDVDRRLLGLAEPADQPLIKRRLWQHVPVVSLHAPTAPLAAWAFTPAARRSDDFVCLLQSLAGQGHPRSNAKAGRRSFCEQRRRQRVEVGSRTVHTRSTRNRAILAWLKVWLHRSSLAAPDTKAKPQIDVEPSATLPASCAPPVPPLAEIEQKPGEATDDEHRRAGGDTPTLC